jgi:hypothetical protein
MDLSKLEYANFALKSLIENRPIEKFVFYNALNGISEFFKSGMTENEKNLVNENIDVFKGIFNILKINYEGGSCIKEIIEVNYLDFNKLVNKLYAIQ